MEKKKFQKLKAKWYDKLAKSGFVDIENADGSIKPPVDPRTAQNAFRAQESTQHYYKVANEFLNAHRFEKDEHKKVWELHCEGLGAVRISKKLKVPIYKVDKLLYEYKQMAGIGRKKHG